MTLRQEASALVDTIPEEYLEKFLEVVKDFKKSFVVQNREEARKKKIFARLDELFAKETPMTEEEERTIRENNQNLIKWLDSMSEIVKDDIPWASEEEMIEELARDRRERWKNAHYA